VSATTPNVLINKIKKLITVIQKKKVFNVFSDMEKCSASSRKSGADLYGVDCSVGVRLPFFETFRTREIHVMQVFGQSPMLLKYSLKHEIAKKMKVTIVAYCGGQSTCFSGRLVT
jgi:hypothetical protein